MRQDSADTLRFPVGHMNRRLLTVFAVAVALAIFLIGLLILREIDINRIEADQIEQNSHFITELQKSHTVLCARGFILIDLTNGALALISQRLEADIRRGDLEAVRADQQFLRQFTKNRENLTRELTDPNSPCVFSP